MKYLRILGSVLFFYGASAAKETQWITVLVHGAFGFQANLSLKTIVQIKKDCIEGTRYEHNVLRMRKHPFFGMVQPMQKMGLVPVEETPGQLNAAYAFGTLFTQVQELCGIHEKNKFYTFGWSGLISQKRRYFEARMLYKELRKLLFGYKKRGIPTKVRILGYSHGGNFVLNLADIRKDEFPEDTFMVDELYLIGMPVHAICCRQVQHSLFKKAYSLYSRGDRVQSIDITTPTHLCSHRAFKGCVPAHLKQIELRVTGCLKRDPFHCLPPNMRGVVDQSPGHIEMWFFGWTPHNYRSNVGLYPLPASVLLPYLVKTANAIDCNHVQIAIRLGKEYACLNSKGDDDSYEVPFFTSWELAGLITKGLTFHPSKPEYKEHFLALQNSNDIKDYL